MEDVLRQAREGTKAELQAFLTAAEEELRALEERRSELSKAMASARAWLGVSDDRGIDGPMSLHDAMQLVLRERAGGMRAGELAKEIERRDLYRMRSGQPADAHQIHARVHNYPQKFIRRDGLIHLRPEGG